MLLPDFVLPELENIVLGSTGLDSVEFCKDRQHFKKFNLKNKFLKKQVNNFNNVLYKNTTLFF